MGGKPDGTTDALASVVLDAALEVHQHLGPAFLESVGLLVDFGERSFRTGCRRIVLTR